MKTILWISRHQMTAVQAADLGQCLGEDFVLLPWKDTVTNLADLEPLIRSADVIGAVLPVEMLAQLVELAGEKPVIQAVSKRLPTGTIRTLPDGRQEEEFLFVHGGWRVIRELRFHSEPFQQK